MLGLRFVGHGTKEMLAFVAPKVWPVLNQTQHRPTSHNNSQQVPTCHANGRNILGATMLRVVGQQCCVRLHGLSELIKSQPRTQAHFTDIITTSVKWAWLRGRLNHTFLLLNPIKYFIITSLNDFNIFRNNYLTSTEHNWGFFISLSENLCFEHMFVDRMVEGLNQGIRIITRHMFHYEQILCKSWSELKIGHYFIFAKHFMQQIQLRTRPLSGRTTVLFQFYQHSVRF